MGTEIWDEIRWLCFCSLLFDYLLRVNIVTMNILSSGFIVPFIVNFVFGLTLTVQGKERTIIYCSRTFLHECMH